jgi:protein TonB
MFEQTFVQGRSRARTGWTALASIGLQTTLVGAGLLVPLLNPELLPKVIGSGVLMAPPPGPAPKPVELKAMAPRTKAPPRLLAGGRLFEPTQVRQVQIVVDPPDLPSASGGPDIGVPGGINGTGSDVVNRFVREAQIATPPPAVKAPPAEEPKKPVRVPITSSLAQSNLVYRVEPVYPPIARTTRTQGKVVVTAIISKDGRITQLQLVEGHPLLVEAALTAIRQWRYKPAMLTGEPVEVVTRIEVNFILNH